MPQRPPRLWRIDKPRGLQAKITQLKKTIKKNVKSLNDGHIRNWLIFKDKLIMTCGVDS